MFGEFLINKKLISVEQLEEALSIQPIAKQKLGRILVELGLLSQNDCDSALEEFLGVKTEKEFYSVISERNDQSMFVKLVIGLEAGYLLLRSPNVLYVSRFTDRLVQEAERRSPNFEVKILTFEQMDLLGKMVQAPINETKDITLASEPSTPVISGPTPYRDLLLSLLSKAKSLNASDVHFDSTLDGLAIRFRVNGDLITVKTIKRELSQSFLTEVKAQTGLPLTVIGSPCSGTARFADLHLKVRAQSNGQIHGETIVLRLIDEEKTKNATIDSIGADDVFKSEIQKALGASSGLILMCGQTGSGKSWTLYSLLMAIDRQSSKVITIEDPVEYEGPGLMQIEVSNGKITFDEALRSSLRLDPDVIMVGEIRDEKTAELAFKAASTGHLVLSTLHTNGAIEALTRLKNLGIAEDLIESNVRLISALTLRKRLCENCKIAVDSDLVSKFSEEVISLAHSEVQFFTRNVHGCSHPDCHQGATGRILMYESINQSQVREYRDGFMNPGFRSLKQCALEMAALGVIGIEEVSNV